MLPGSSDPYWNVRENLQKVQPKYGAAPFFKLGIDVRNAPPFDYIITVSEGDLGLPSYEFYTLEERHPVRLLLSLQLRYHFGFIRVVMIMIRLGGCVNLLSS